jgi:hypothetical protein
MISYANTGAEIRIGCGILSLAAALPAAQRATPASREVAAPVVAAFAPFAASARFIPASVEAAASVCLPLSITLEALEAGAEPAARVVVGGGEGNVARPAAV